MWGVTTGVRRTTPLAQLATRSWAATGMPRRVYRVSCLSPPLGFGVHANNLVNLLRAVRERVFSVEVQGTLVSPPRPAPGVIAQELEGFAEQFRRRVVTTHAWSTEQFVDSYKGRRRVVYEQAAASLTRKPVNRRDANSGAFLKAEKIPFYLKPDPAPRLIHPRDPRYNVAVGRYLKRIEHDVYHAIDGVWGYRTVLKGYNAHSVAGILRRKWEAESDPVALMWDASRFDQHVSADALQWEHQRYLEHFRGHERAELERLLQWQLRTRVYARCKDGMVKYTVDGMRFSGDMNTGMGNCLLMSAMMYAVCKRMGIRAQLANNGDDCVLIMGRSEFRRLDQELFRSWFRRLGFNLKAEGVTDVFEQIDFCQTRPVYDGDRWVMVRRHGHAQAKDCISIKPLDHPRLFDAWRLSVGQAGLSLTGGIPVQQEFYLAFMRGAKGVALRGDPTQETGFARLAVGMDRKASEPTAKARYSYWLAFGVTPDEQIALEAQYRRVTPAWHVSRAEGVHTVHHDKFLL